MSTPTKNADQGFPSVGAMFFEQLWSDSWTYIKTVVDVMREPVVILDEKFRVLTANEPFYQMFHVGPYETEHKVIYELGNGQWDIPALRKLLEDVLPHHTFFKGFEVNHEFPGVGRKVVLLNARQIYFQAKTAVEKVPPIIMLAMEDVTDMMAVAESMADHAKRLEINLADQANNMDERIKRLEQEIIRLKGKS